jgi:hypothetical protein
MGYAGCTGCVKRTYKYLQMCRYLILSADVDIYLISSTDKIIENHPALTYTCKGLFLRLHNINLTLQ